MGTVGEAERRGIAARGCGSARGDIDAKPRRIREFREKRQQDAARAGAKIEEAQRCSAIGDRSQNRRDHSFSIRSRIERVGRQDKLHPPKLAPADDAAQGLTIDHPGQRRSNLKARLIVDGPFDIYSDRELTGEALRIALEYQVTPYDASYVALAMKLKTDCATADRKLFEKLRNTALRDYVTFLADSIH